MRLMFNPQLSTTSVRFLQAELRRIHDRLTNL